MKKGLSKEMSAKNFVGAVLLYRNIIDHEAFQIPATKRDKSFRLTTPNPKRKTLFLLSGNP